MIIGHDYRYVFLELPYTGTRSVSEELRRFYGGEKILTKHANFAEFARFATSRERSYFVFCGVRNPLEIPVSLFLKYRNKPVEELWLGDVGRDVTPNLLARIYDRLERKRVARAKLGGIGFDEFFLKSFVLPYDNWSRVSFDSCDFVMRFERLQTEFSEVLNRLGIKQVRELPRRGNGVAWSHDPAEYYGRRARSHARRVFGCYMERMGYKFPADWAVDDISFVDRANYSALGLMRSAYWKWLRVWLDRDIRKAASVWPHAV